MKRDTPPRAMRGSGVHCCGIALERANFVDRAGASPGNCPLQGCPGYGVSRRPGANRFRRDFLGWLLSVLECGRVGDGCASLIGCTRSWSLARRLIGFMRCWSVLGRLNCRAQCRRVFQSQESCWRFALLGGSARVERVQRAEAGFKRSSCRASSSVDFSCDSLSLPLVLSLHRHVSSVLMLHCLRIHTHIIHLHACTRNSLARSLPAWFCMLHDLF